MANNIDYKLLKDWINNEQLDNKNIINLKGFFLKNKPYKYLELRNFLNEKKAKSILLALSKERFYEKNSDLFKFYQTNDIASSKNPKLAEFRNFLASGEFIGYIRALTGFKLKIGKVDLAGTLYKDTNFLLCHDDRLETRKIAFLLYLSDLEEKDGASLNLMDRKFRKIAKIIPQFNKFIFFEVSNHSFHEVEELIKDKQRIALGGWFHDK